MRSGSFGTHPSRLDNRNPYVSTANDSQPRQNDNTHKVFLGLTPTTAMSASTTVRPSWRGEKPGVDHTYALFLHRDEHALHDPSLAL